jgi:hypothetical protein
MAFTAMISHFVKSDQRDWDEWVQVDQIAYQITPHLITEYSPFFLLHGREMTLPFPLNVRPKFSRFHIKDDIIRSLAHKLRESL